jgi:hypothetical protein
MAGPGIKEAPLTSAIAIDASYLPVDLHGDPGDRLIVATARHVGLPDRDPRPPDNRLCRTGPRGGRVLLRR